MVEIMMTEQQTNDSVQMESYMQIEKSLRKHRK